MQARIKIVLGDITRQEADAIVPTRHCWGEEEWTEPSTGPRGRICSGNAGPWTDVPQARRR